MIGSKTEQAVEQEDGEPWLVSYADLVTLLFGFFVVLYSMSSIDERKLSAIGQDIASSLGKKTETTDTGYLTEARLLRAMQLLVATLNIGETAEDGVQTIEKLAMAESQGKQLDETLARDRKKLSNLGASLRLDGDGSDQYARVAIPAKVLFKPGAAVLTHDARKRLEPLVATLLKLGDVAALEVVGHSDSSPMNGATSPFGSNLGLSAARAAAVADVLVGRGVDRNLVTVSGRGDAEPLFAERDNRGRVIVDHQERNRRVEIVIKRAGHP